MTKISSPLFDCFESYTESLDASHFEGVSGRDTGSMPPSTKNARMKFFITGQIRAAWNSLHGNGAFGGAIDWQNQNQDKYDKALANYRDADGQPDLAAAMCDPRVIQLMEYCESSNEEVEVYQYWLDNSLNTYRELFREDFDTKTLMEQAGVRKVEVTEDEKAELLKRMARLQKKTA